MKRQFHPTNPFRPENGIWPDEDRYLDDDQIANQIPSANSIQHWQWSDRGDSTELKITEVKSCQFKNFLVFLVVFRVM